MVVLSHPHSRFSFSQTYRRSGTVRRTESVPVSVYGVTPVLSVQSEYVLIKIQFVPVDLPDDGGLVVLRVLGAALNGHGVPGFEVVRPVDAAGLDAVRLRLLLVQFAVGEGEAAAAPGGLQAAELSGQGVVPRFVRENYDVGPQGGEGLLPRRYRALSLPVIVKSGTVHPAQFLPAVEAAGALQRPVKPPRRPGGQEREVVAGEVAHVPQFPVVCAQVVVQAAELHLLSLLDAVSVEHTWQFHTPPSVNSTNRSSASI